MPSTRSTFVVPELPLPKSRISIPHNFPTTVKRNGQEYVFIDTAGLRRKSKIKKN